MTAEVGRTLKGESFPLTKSLAVRLMKGRESEGLDVQMILRKALRRRSYGDLSALLRDLEDWLNAQG